MLSVQNSSIPEVKILRPKIFPDSRGFVTESFNSKRYKKNGFTTPFVQENLSFSKNAGTLRGLHFQKPPHAQAKLIQVLAGKIFDVAIDVRPDSPTFGKYASIILSSDEPTLFYIPRGFAHGFYTLEDNTTVLYKIDAYYAPESEGGIKWDDPDLNIAWPLLECGVSLSDKDAVLPTFQSLEQMDWS